MPLYDAYMTSSTRPLMIGDMREIFLLVDWQSIEEARKFMTSDELRDAMAKAGVVGAPDVQYLEDARSVHRTSAD